MTQSTDAAIRAHCLARGWRFRPWEVHPADATEGASPWPATTAGAATWGKARTLRAQIVVGLEEDHG